MHGVGAWRGGREGLREREERMGVSMPGGKMGGKKVRGAVKRPIMP